MKHFFDVTEGAAKQFSGLFDFAWAVGPALWNLRWQVRGFLTVVPEATKEEIDGRFVLGSEIQGSNLKKACIDTPWDEQKSILASFILINAISIYEYWADSILKNFDNHSFHSNNLQFDGSNGLPEVVAHLANPNSIVMREAFFPKYRGHRRYSWDKISNLLKCYRYFKEARNSQAHGGGFALERAVSAYRNFKPVSDRQSLGMRGNLVIEPLSSEMPVKLHLRGVVGFCDVLLRLMTTVDAELSKSIQAERLLETKLRNALPNQTMLSSDANTRRKQTIHRCRAAGLPNPINADAVYEFMLDRSIIRA